MSGAFDVRAVRAQFPILAEPIHKKRLAYLDNGATTQKPQCVIDALSHHWTHDNANIHRAVHLLGARSTEGYEGARAEVARFLNARTEREVIFTRGTTEAINLVAQSFARPRLKAGDHILVTGLEHHANLVPWQLVAEQASAHITHVPLLDDGSLDLDAVPALLAAKPVIFACGHVSNALGTVNPVAALAAQARAHGVPMLVDGAQAVAHLPAAELDVQALGVDFYVFSGHKIYAPTGIGALWGKLAHLERMPPWQGGGDMIREVTLERSTFAPAPARFEAGTPPIAQAIGLGRALRWFTQELDRSAALAHEDRLLRTLTSALAALPGIRLIGTAAHKVAVQSFVLDYAHPHDAATIFDFAGVAVRAGHHCAQPVMTRFGVPATLRASLGVYNDEDDIEQLVRAIERVRAMFA